MFTGSGEYRLDAFAEIKVTDSYLGLDENVRECQNQESFYECTTRNYLDTCVKQCGCLPANIKSSNKVTTG